MEPDEPTPTWSLGMTALRGAASWSDVYLSEPLWAEYAHAAADVPSPSEVYIAIAIREGLAGAIASFEVMYFGVIDRALVRAGATASEIAKLKELMRAWLFETRAGERSRIDVLAGQGKFPSLLRTAALRALGDLRAQLAA